MAINNSLKFERMPNLIVVRPTVRTTSIDHIMLLVQQEKCFYCMFFSVFFYQIYFIFCLFFFFNIILLCLVNPWKFDCLFFIYFRSALITLLSQHQLHLLLLFGFHQVEQCSSHQKRHSLSETTWPLLLNLASIWKVTWQRIIQRLDGLEEIF